MLPFELAVIVLAAALFFPISKLVWVLSIRRLERKLGHPLEDAERAAQLRRARIIAAVLALAFSWLFNLQLTSKLASAAGAAIVLSG